jgi:hypothetical protein
MMKSAYFRDVDSTDSTVADRAKGKGATSPESRMPMAGGNIWKLWRWAHACQPFKSPLTLGPTQLSLLRDC